MQELKRKIEVINVKIDSLYELVELEGFNSDLFQLKIKALNEEKEKCYKDLLELIPVNTIVEEKNNDPEYVVLKWNNNYEHIPRSINQDQRYDKPDFRTKKTYIKGECDFDIKTMLSFLKTKNIEYNEQNNMYAKQDTFNIILTYYSIKGYLLDCIDTGKNKTIQFVKKQHNPRHYHINGCFKHNGSSNQVDYNVGIRVRWCFDLIN